MRTLTTSVCPSRALVMKVTLTGPLDCPVVLVRLLRLKLAAALEAMLNLQHAALTLLLLTSSNAASSPPAPHMYMAPCGNCIPSPSGQSILPSGLCRKPTRQSS